jgi:phosphoribosylaminoimidazolecarboxamide formyltransferase/IMP cyclohydrolase
LSKRTLIQERNNITDNKDLKTVTVTSPTEQEIQDLIFASKVCKTQNLTRSFLQKRNTSSGTGQTSRVDALLQAIEKQNLGFDLNGAVMASDAFFFPRLCSNCKEAV